MPSGKGREEWDQGGIHRSLRFTHEVLFLKLAGEILSLCCFLHIWYGCIKWQRHPGYLLENSCMCSVQQINRTGGRGALSPQLATSNPQPKQLLLFLPQFDSIWKVILSQLPHSHLHTSTPPPKPTAKSMRNGPSLGALLSGSLGPAPVICEVICSPSSLGSIMQLLIKFFIQQNLSICARPCHQVSESQD